MREGFIWQNFSLWLAIEILEVWKLVFEGKTDRGEEEGIKQKGKQSL